MKKIFLLFLGLILISTLIVNVFTAEENSITVTILYDNYPFEEGLKTDWGFACLIQGTEKTILLDTGTKGDIFLHNINRLKTNLKDIEAVVLSHEHGDHIGGLSSFLKENSRVSVYAPVSFSDRFFNSLEEKNVNIIRVDEPVEICRNVFTTGEMGVQIIEQSLVLKTDKGLVVLTGCAHPGIVDIVKKSKEILDQNVYLVFGGFHLYQKTEAQVKEIISQFRDLGVLKVGATHCTGDIAIKLFKDAYEEDFVQLGVGKILKLDTLQK